jgi:hypothetical protein
MPACAGMTGRGRWAEVNVYWYEREMDCFPRFRGGRDDGNAC